MLQRYTSYTSRLRTWLRPLTPFLYLCLILSLTWYESSFTPFTSSTPAPTTIAWHSGDYGGAAVRQGSASHRLPSLLSSAPKLPSSARLRTENRGNDLPPAQLCWAITADTLCLSPLRIDPVVWDSGTPSFLLPSAYGLVPFAIPPPFRFT